MSSALVLLAGVLVAAGVVALVVALAPAAPRLDAALERVGGGDRLREAPPETGTGSHRSERLGAYLYRRNVIPLTAGQRRALKLQDKTVAEFAADKAVMAVVGALVPGSLGAAVGFLTGSLTALPVAAAVAGAVVGFFVPDLLLRRGASAVRTGALESLLLYIELVTLERLTNASASQALQKAAELSETPLFVQIRSALERARLEQQPPYAELRRLAESLDLPQLVDVADVMQLDETGAALSGSLRARVRELRDAHLTEEQIRASADAEGMTVYMTLPSLIFGLIFLGAALLRIVGA